MRASYGVIVSISILSVAGLIHQACGGGSSPTAPAAPQTAVGSQATSGDQTGSTQLVVGPAIDIEKSTNGFDADTPPGPSVPVGADVEWTYVVTNIGDVTLTNWVVNDDKLDGVVCRGSDLEAGDFIICMESGVAGDGPYVNVAEVTASDGDTRVSDTDPSHYLGGGGAFVAIEVEKSTNDEDADFEPGPIVNVDQTVEWEYVVTNLGDVTLTNWVVNDDQLGEVCRGSNLAVGASSTCTESGVASADQYVNVAEVTASDGNIRVTDEDPSHYFGSDPAISIDKLTDGDDDQELYVGCPVVWTYEVTNEGNIDLENIAVTDDEEDNVSCPSNTLAPGRSMVCEATGIVIEGPYNNLGTVTATAPVNNLLEESDPSNYLGVSRPPTCDDAFADPDILWPPNHKLESVAILGVVDACGDTTTITIDSIFQDEPLDSEGDGNTEPDGFGVGTDTAEIRAERAGTGNGRVYHIDFTATDFRSETCTGTVTVGVPHDRHDTPIDDGPPYYDSTGGS
jgi:hypothetical protein